MKIQINGVEMFLYDVFFDKYADPGECMAHPEKLTVKEVAERCFGVVTSAPMPIPSKADLLRIGFVKVKPEWLPLWSLSRHE